MDGTRVRPVKEKWGTRREKKGDASHPSSLTENYLKSPGKKKKRRKVSLHSNGLTLKVEGKRSRRKR